MYELGHVTADLVVLTVLPEEYAAVLACLQEPELVRGSMTSPNKFVWRLGTIASHYGAPFKVVVGMATRTTTFGALATSQAIELFDLKYIAFVGVAGGFDQDGQRHGDVAVSSKVTAYEYGKVDTGGFAPRSDFTYRCNDALVRATDAARATGERWWRDDENPTGPPSVRTGMIASGDKVIDDPDEAFFAAVRTVWPKLLAVEMEGAGVAAAVHDVQGHRSIGFILVRGISDMPHPKTPGAPAGTQERDGWKVTAARNAARFLAHLVSTAWPVPPRDIGATASDLTATDEEPTTGAVLASAAAASQASHQHLARKSLPGERFSRLPESSVAPEPFTSSPRQQTTPPSGVNYPRPDWLTDEQASVCAQLGNRPTWWFHWQYDRDGFQPGSTHVTAHADPLQLPPQYEAVHRQLVPWLEKRALRAGRQIHDGPLLALQQLRTAGEDPFDLTIDLALSSYYRYQATLPGCGGNPELAQEVAPMRIRDLQSWQPRDGNSIPAHLSNGVGLCMALVTGDDRLLLSRRASVPVSRPRPGEWDVAVVEGLHPGKDTLGTRNPEIDLWKVAARAVYEELGLRVARNQIHLLSFGVDCSFFQWNVLGYYRTSKTAKEVIQGWSSHARDAHEHGKLESVSAEPESVFHFLRSRRMWGSGLMALYVTLSSLVGDEDPVAAAAARVFCD